MESGGGGRFDMGCKERPCLPSTIVMNALSINMHDFFGLK